MAMLGFPGPQWNELLSRHGIAVASDWRQIDETSLQAIASDCSAQHRLWLWLAYQTEDQVLRQQYRPTGNGANGNCNCGLGSQ